MLVPNNIAKKNFQKNLYGLYYDNGIIINNVQRGNKLNVTIVHECIHCFLSYLFYEEEGYEEFGSITLEEIYYNLRHETIAYSLSNWWDVQSFNNLSLVESLSNYTIDEIKSCLSKQGQFFVFNYIKHFRQKVSLTDQRGSLVVNSLKTPDFCQWLS